MNRRSFVHGKGENCRENLNKNNVHTRENIVTQNIAFLVSSLTFKKILSTLHNIGHIVEKEKSGCVLNHHFVVMTLVHEDTRKNLRGSFWPGRGLG